MEKITSLAELRATIAFLENKKEHELTLLKVQFKTTLISLKPTNLIKNKFSEIVSDPNLKENILNTVLSLATGYLSKKLIMGTTHNPIKQLVGTLLQVGVTGLVAKNSDGIKSTASQLLSFFSKKSASDN